jgi:hypothetical protein
MELHQAVARTCRACVLPKRCLRDRDGVSAVVLHCSACRAPSWGFTLDLEWRRDPSRRHIQWPNGDCSVDLICFKHLDALWTGIRENRVTKEDGHSGAEVQPG